MGEALITRRGGGGAKINGIIEQYKVAAGENISAGDFVQFVESVTAGPPYTMTGSPGRSAEGGVSAVKLSHTEVFVAHSGDSANRSYVYMYGTVFIVSENTVTAGVPTQLSTRPWSGENVKAILVSPGRVFVAGRGRWAEETDLLRGLVATIEGTTITAGSHYQLSDLPDGGQSIEVVKLPDTRALVIHGYPSGDPTIPKGFVISFPATGRALTVGPSTQLKLSTVLTRAILLPSGDVFAVGTYARRQLTGEVITVSGSDVTAGTATTLAPQQSSNSATGNGAAVVLLSNGKVFVAHAVNEGVELEGMVLTISGKTITVEKRTSLGGEADVRYIDAINLPMNRILITYGYNSKLNNLGCMLVKLTGLSMRGEKLASLHAAYGGGKSILVLLTEDKVFLTCTKGTSANPNYPDVYCRVANAPATIGKYAGYNDGVAKSGGSAGTTIQIYRPN